MMRLAEIMIFGAVALVLHAVVLWQTDLGARPAAGGVAGGPVVTGASEDLSALVGSWEAEPDMAGLFDLARLEVPPEQGTEHAPVTPTSPSEQPDIPRQVTSLGVPVVFAPAGSADAPSFEPPRVDEPEPEPSLAPRLASLPVAKPADKIPHPVVDQQPRTQARQQERKQPRQQPSAQKAAKERAEPWAEPAPHASRTPATGGQAGAQATGAATPSASSGESTAQGFTTAEIVSAKERYVAAVRRAVMRRHTYPRRAQQRGIEGKAMVRVTLDKGGSLVDAILVRSSGAGILDNAAMATVRKVERYPAIPPEMEKARVSITLPILFRKR